MVKGPLFLVCGRGEGFSWHTCVGRLESDTILSMLIKKFQMISEHSPVLPLRLMDPSRSRVTKMWIFNC